MSRLFMALAIVIMLVLISPFPMALICSEILERGERCAVLGYLTLGSIVWWVMLSPVIALLLGLSLHFREKEARKKALTVLAADADVNKPNRESPP